MNPVHITSYLRSILILPFHLHNRCHRSFKIPCQHLVCISRLSYICHVSCRSHSPWFDYSNNSLRDCWKPRKLVKIDCEPAGIWARYPLNTNPELYRCTKLLSFLLRLTVTSRLRICMASSEKWQNYCKQWTEKKYEIRNRSLVLNTVPAFNRIGWG